MQPHSANSAITDPEVMFGFSKPQAPLTTYQRLDIELLMRKTIETIGVDAAGRSEILSDVGSLSLDNSSPSRLVQSAAREVGQRMNMPDVVFDLQIADGRELGYPSTYKLAGHEGCSVLITVADDTARDPLRTVMELAYQYSYHFWNSQPGATPLDTDPRTTNLLPVCFGMGVLASDACLYDQQWSQAGWSGWSISRSGYYNASELGYAMALLARTRGEAKPPWIRRLRLDSKVAANQAWRYFESHQKVGGGLLFDANKIPSSKRDMKELADWLSGADMTFALAAGFALSHFDELPPLVIDAAMVATQSGDMDLIPVAVRLLAGMRRDRADVVDRVRKLIRSDSPAIALAAVQAADALGVDLTEYQAKLGRLLEAYAEDAFDLLGVIGQQGHRLGILDAQVCDHLARSIEAEDAELASAFLQCLCLIVDNPKRSIERHIKSPEIQQQAIARLA